MKTLAEYQADFAEVIVTKPAEADIPQQVATVSVAGQVSIQFSSDNMAEIKQLRDWLSSLLGQ